MDGNMLHFELGSVEKERCFTNERTNWMERNGRDIDHCVTIPVRGWKEEVRRGDV